MTDVENGNDIKIEATEGSENDLNALDYSRPLDVHKWSDHPEVNEFIDAIYAKFFEGRFNERIRKKHIKIVLLDLYVAWRLDPQLRTAFHRNVDHYNAGSRYNELNISRTTIPVVDTLIEFGFISQQLGFFDRREGGQSRISRIWPSDLLVHEFERVAWPLEAISSPPDRECIVLRDENNDLEYDDTDAIREMRAELEAYNSLIDDTFVDIPTLEENFVTDEYDEAPHPRDRVFVSQHDKFTRRIFNRGSFELGGRFYGGWWQRIPLQARNRIFLDHQPVSEIDYSGLHIVLLYAQYGVNYWERIDDDPYRVRTPDFLGADDHFRDLCKKLFLTAINAQNEEAAFDAFRFNAPTGSFQKNLTNDQLRDILTLLREKHPIIAEDIASDAGIGLMNIDSRITARILADFTEQQIPVLSVHDSYLVPFGFETMLANSMITAFENETGIPGARITEETEQPDRYYPDSASGGFGPSEEQMAYRHDPPMSERYSRAFDQFIEHHGKPRIAHWINQYD